MVGFPIPLSLLPYNNVFYYTQGIHSYFLSLSIQDQNSVLLSVLELKTDYCLMKRKLSLKAGLACFRPSSESSSDQLSQTSSIACGKCSLRSTEPLGLNPIKICKTSRKGQRCIFPGCCRKHAGAQAKLWGSSHRVHSQQFKSISHWRDRGRSRHISGSLGSVSSTWQVPKPCLQKSNLKCNLCL